MKHSEMRDGQKVRLVRSIDLFPDAIVRAGEVGVLRGVVPLSSATRPHDVIGEVVLETHYRTLDSWDNCVVMRPETCEIADAVPSALEVIT